MSFFTAWFRLRPSAPVGVETIDCSRVSLTSGELADIDIAAPRTAAAIAQLEVQKAAAHVVVDIGKPDQRTGIAGRQFQKIVGAVFRQLGDDGLAAVRHRRQIDGIDLLASGGVVQIDVGKGLGMEPGDLLEIGIDGDAFAITTVIAAGRVAQAFDDRAYIGRTAVDAHPETGSFDA